MMRKRRWLSWLARTLAISFALLISLIALDVFSMGLSPGDALLALLIHLIPTLIILLVLLVAWRWEGIGGLLFIVLGFAYVGATWSVDRIWVYALISGPLLLIGLLFVLAWFSRPQETDPR